MLALAQFLTDTLGVAAFFQLAERFVDVVVINQHSEPTFAKEAVITPLLIVAKIHDRILIR